MSKVAMKGKKLKDYAVECYVKGITDTITDLETTQRVWVGKR